MKNGLNSLATMEEEVSEDFVRRMHGEWSPHHQAALESRLELDPAYADAYRRVEQSWGSLDAHAESAELMRYREEALGVARQANARRWLKGGTRRWRGWRAVAGIGGIFVSLAIAWQLSPYGYTPGVYRTDIGEQRVLDLADHSRIALDAATRLKIRYTADARSVELEKGQAQFSVAKDPARPFKVMAGGRTIVAVGTVFTVEYVDSQVHVAMMEGKVAVLATGVTPTIDAQGDEGISLVAGEELRVSRDGRSTVTPKADLEAATAWRDGKVIIRAESLGEAVERMNRYSPLQIQIDDASLAAKHVSGVFEAGDTPGFVHAIELYLPVTADYSDSRTVKLRIK